MDCRLDKSCSDHLKQESATFLKQFYIGNVLAKRVEGRKGVFMVDINVKL